MEKVNFTSKGLLILNNGTIELMGKFEADSLDELQNKIIDKFNKTKGVESLGLFARGGIVGITKETIIEIDGDEYINTKLSLEFIDDITQEEMDKLQEYYFNFLVK
jgi:hypothetical protein